MTQIIKIKKQVSGFTLIELMIVVAIIGILSSIAYPSYTKYVQKSKRTDAMVAVMRAAQMQEKYFSQNLKYAYREEELFGVAAGTAIDSDQGLYSIDVSGQGVSSGATVACSAAIACTSFTVKATAKAGKSQIHDETCRTFSLTNTGVKSSQKWSGGALASNASGTCW